MRSINRSTLEGNLTHDVDLRRLPSGSPVATLRVGFNTSQRTDTGWGDRSHYLDIEVFGRQAEECATHLQRGSYVLIDGHLESQNWTDRDNNRRHRVFLVADLVRWPSGQPARLRETVGPAQPVQRPSGPAQPAPPREMPQPHQPAAPPQPASAQGAATEPAAPQPPFQSAAPAGAEGAIPITEADLPF